MKMKRYDGYGVGFDVAFALVEATSFSPLNYILALH
jgi:hypothetical protein